MPVKPNINQKTIDMFRDMGYLIEKVEYFNSFTKRYKDLFGIFDYIAVGNGETVAIQVTSRSNMSSRIKKIQDSDNLTKCRDANWRIIVIGWDKPAHRWRSKTVDIS